MSPSPRRIRRRGAAQGWCPREDRIVAPRDGRCPDCGATVVDLAARPRVFDGPIVVVAEEEDVTAEDATSVVPDDVPSVLPPPAIQEGKAPQRVELGTFAIAALGTAIIVLAFLAGFALPRVRDRGAERPMPAALSEYKPRTVSYASGIPLRLDRFSQRGSRITARFVVPEEAPLAVGGLQSVMVRPIVGRQTANAVRMDVRATTNGFIVDGSLPVRKDVPLSGIAIAALEGRSGDGSLDLDMALIPLWPKGETPSASADAVDGRTFRLEDGRSLRAVGAVGWRDRIDVALQITGARDGWEYHDRYVLTVPDKRQAGRRAGTIVDPDVPVRHIFFDVSPRFGSLATITMRYGEVTVHGEWIWQFS